MTTTTPTTNTITTRRALDELLCVLRDLRIEYVRRVAHGYEASIADSPGVGKGPDVASAIRDAISKGGGHAINR